MYVALSGPLTYPTVTITFNLSPRFVLNLTPVTYQLLLKFVRDRFISTESFPFKYPQSALYKYFWWQTADISKVVCHTTLCILQFHTVDPEHTLHVVEMFLRSFLLQSIASKEFFWYSLKISLILAQESRDWPSHFHFL